MKYSEFLKKAAPYIELVRHGGGHDIYRVKSSGLLFPVPRHQSEEMKTGLQNKLMKQVGLK